MRLPWKISRGSITLVALSLAVVIGISLGSYIALCQQSLQLSMRKGQLSRARQLAETGLEEALWALDNGINGTWNASGPNADVTWTGTTTTSKACSLPGPSMPAGYNLGEGATGALALTIDFNAPNSPDKPKITATATVTVPGFGVFTKTLNATTKPAPLFANAIGVSNVVSTNYLLLFGGTVVDSWNSNPSGTGFVPYTFLVGSKSNYAAVVAAPSILLNNNATVYGYAATFGNTITPSTTCLVKGPTTPAALNVDPVRVSKSAFVPNFTVATPTGATYGTLDGSSITIDNTLGSSPQIWDASPADLNLTGTVTIKGKVIIRVPGDLNLSGNKFVIYKPVSPGPDKGQLEIFVQGNITIDPASQFQNDTQEPKTLAIYSTNPGSRIFEYNSNQDFCGVMYSASTTANLEIKTSPNFYGAVLAQCSPHIDNNPFFHYDLALQNLPKGWFKGVATPFIIVQLTES